MVSLLERLGHARIVERLAPARTSTREPVQPKPPTSLAADDPLRALGEAGTLAHGFLHVRTPWPLRPPTLARTPLGFAERVHERPRLLGGALDRLVLPELDPLAEALASLTGTDASATRRAVFLDGETTGLDGVPFVLGIAHVEGDALIVEQWTLARLDAERSMLAAVFVRLAALGVAPLVSFNGASFDVPLLRRRAAQLGLAADVLACDHVDLLHAARRLAGDRVDDHRLGTLEREWLDVHRRDDLPSHEIPRVYAAWLAKLDDPVALGRLRAVVLHNQADLVSLPALAMRLAARLDAPDDLAMASQAAQLLIRHGRLARARALLERALAGEVRLGTAWREAQACLAELERRDGEHERAAACWRRILAVFPDEPEACSALAKLLEHRLGSLDEALAIACRSRTPERERIARLERKLGRASGGERASATAAASTSVGAVEVEKGEVEKGEVEKGEASEPSGGANELEIMGERSLARAELPLPSSPAWQASVALRFAPWRREARGSVPDATPPSPAVVHASETLPRDDERPRTTYRLFVGR